MMEPRTATTAIVLHCTAGPDRPTLDWPGVCRYHTNPPPAGRGYHAPGYHFGVELADGDILVLPGRAPHLEGAHCRAHSANRYSLGVAVVGDFDFDPPAPALLRATSAVLANLALAYAIPVESILGHREFDPRKTCPGARWPLETTRAMVAAILHEQHQLNGTDTAGPHWFGRHIRLGEL